MMGTLRQAGIQPGAVVSAELGDWVFGLLPTVHLAARSTEKHPLTCLCRV